MFRAAEITRIREIIRAGESASLIGVSGVGKSNLFNQLLNREIQQHMFGNEARNYLIIRINCHYVADLTLRSIYSMILDQLELLGDDAEFYGYAQEVFDKVSEHHDLMLTVDNDPLVVQRQFILALRQLMRARNRKLVLLIDQFEELWQDAPARIFLNLRGLRDVYKYRVSIFTFTRNPLPILADLDDKREEFFELLAANVIGICPHCADDATHVVQRIRKRYRLDSVDNARIYQLAGGHAGLLRAILLAKTPLSERELLTHHNVQNEARKIYHSVTHHEQQVLYQLAHQGSQVASEPTHWLKLKGLVLRNNESDKPVIFSPLFRAFLLSQPAPVSSGILLDHNQRRIIIDDRPTGRLTQLEYRVFKALYDDPGALISRDDIINAGWPEAYGGISDDMINQVMRRLRTKLKPVADPSEILETVRGGGYRLKSII